MKIAIMGATGYVGFTLVQWLLRHPNIKIEVLTTQNYAGKHLCDLDRRFLGQELPRLIEHTEIDQHLHHIDIVFFALPHGASRLWVERITNHASAGHIKCIDLSSDYRLNSEAHYGITGVHITPRGQRLISNPGCYPTASILALAPLLAHGIIDPSDIVIDAKSGVSGAGKSAKIENLFCEINESIKPYGVCNHRHGPEIEKHLSQIAHENVRVQFTPHLIPMQNGLLASCYCRLNEGALNPLASLDDTQIEPALFKLYRDFYHQKPFIHLIEGLPETRWVVGTNDAHISLRYDARTRRIMCFCAIDNTVRGAAGQAIQNMNMAMGWQETLGLDFK